MTDQAASLAALNVTLLEAIAAGPVAGPTELAERAGIIPNHVNRKLASLLEAGLIAKTGEGSCDVALTETGQRGLTVMAIWRDGIVPPAAAGDLTATGIAYIRFDRIDPWALNPRTHFDPAGVEDMAQSVADRGVLQPLTVRAIPDSDRFEVIIGERRRRGAALAVERGWIDDPGFCVPCQVRNLSDDEALDDAGVENLQRADLHWMDEARFYLRLSERGRSGAEIARLAGESVSKRKVQDYVKIARELPAAEIARCYLPDGHKDQLIYARARDMVGDKKPALALDLSPKLAVSFLEIVNAAMRRDGRIVDGRASWSIGHKHIARFARAPQPGGTLATLIHDRKLIHCSFFDFGMKVGREVGAQVTITEEVDRWLRQIGFHTDAPGTLRKLRADVLGDLVASTMHREARNFVQELNLPAEAAPATPAPEPPPPAGEGDREAVEGALNDTSEPDDHDGEDDNLFADDPPAEPTDEDLAPYLRRLIGDTSAQPAPAPTSAPELGPILQIVLLEAADKIAQDGQRHPTGPWCAPILAEAHRDARLDLLIKTHKLLRLLPNGERWMIALTTDAIEWLEANTAVHFAADARPAFAPLHTLAHYQSDLGITPRGDARYSTFWLNPAAAPAPQVETEGVLHGDGTGEALPTFDPEVEQEAPDPTAEIRRALAALHGAARQAARYLDSLPGKTKAPKREDVGPIIEMLGRAIDTARPHLGEDVAQ